MRENLENDRPYSDELLDNMATADESPTYAGRLLTVSKVAAILGVSGTTVRRWLRAGAMDGVMLPSVATKQGDERKRQQRENWRVYGSYLDDLLSSHGSSYEQ